MLAVSLGQAKAIAVGIVAVLVLGSIGSAWLMKTIIQKLIVGAVLVGLAVIVWTQRAALDDCADGVRSQATTSVASVDTTCRFLGQDITISAGPLSDDSND